MKYFFASFLLIMLILSTLAHSWQNKQQLNKITVQLTALQEQLNTIQLQTASTFWKDRNIIPINRHPALMPKAE